MYIPPGGGPAPHCHNFEKTFVVLEGQIEATFRGQVQFLEAGTIPSIPSDAPHQIHNASSSSTRLLCICSPAGLDEFFQRIGVPVATLTTAPPKLAEEQQREFLAKAKALAPEYHTELLPEA